MSYKLYQGGLGLPEREYYFKNDSVTVAIRKAYIKYITRLLVMSGEDSTKANKEAVDILTLETKLARSSRKLEELRDPYRNYNKMAIVDLDKLASNVNSAGFLPTTGGKKYRFRYCWAARIFYHAECRIEGYSN